MKTVYLTSETMLQAPCAATIGFFDGVHRGHVFLLDQLRQISQARRLPTAVITFAQHPLEVIAPERAPKQLCPLSEKLQLLEAAGADLCVILPFTQALSQLSAGEFMQQILKRQLAVETLLLGHDNRFGRRQGETFADYARLGQENGIDVMQAEALMMQKTPVSSSYIRQLLSQGDIEKATECLGRNYMLNATVVEGRQTGRKLGYPTANLQLNDSRMLIPAHGAYVVSAQTDDWPARLAGMMNIGMHPTFETGEQTLEVHLLDFADNLYGKHLSVAFHHRLRPEQRFESIESLHGQLQEDETETRNYFKQNKIL